MVISAEKSQRGYVEVGQSVKTYNMNGERKISFHDMQSAFESASRD